EPAKAVFTERVRPCDVKRHVCSGDIQRLVQAAAQRLEKDFIPAAVGQLTVQTTALFAKAIIDRAVYRESEDTVIAGKDRSGTIALMYIGIDDQDTPGEALVLHDPRRDGYVVEHAETFSVIGVCVVRSTGQVCCQPVSQRSPAGFNGRTDRTAGAFH